MTIKKDIDNNVPTIIYFLTTYFLDDCDIEEISETITEFIETEDKKKSLCLQLELDYLISLNDLSIASDIFKKWGKRLFKTPSEQLKLKEILIYLRDHIIANV